MTVICAITPRWCFELQTSWKNRKETNNGDGSFSIRKYFIHFLSSESPSDAGHFHRTFCSCTWRYPDMHEEKTPFGGRQAVVLQTGKGDIDFWNPLKIMWHDFQGNSGWRTGWWNCGFLLDSSIWIVTLNSSRIQNLDSWAVEPNRQYLTRNIKNSM